jgi:uncharacterized protein YbjT (DUF2867 family)
MRHQKKTIFLAVVVALLAWLYASGIEPDRAPAQLAPFAKEPRPGAVLVIGGTRGTGLEVVKLLRTRGDDVIVLARPNSDASAAEKLGARVVRGDALRPAEIKAALAVTQVRAVVSTLGARQVKEPRPDFAGNRNAIDAAKEAGVRRFVIVTVIGAGDSLTAAPAFARRFLKNIISDKTQAENYLRASGLDYTIIRPGGLLDNEAQGRAYLTEDQKAMSWIRRADLARLIVQALDDPSTAGRIYHAFDPERTRFWSMFVRR